MTTYARIQNGVVAEVFTPPSGVSIASCFVASVAAEFIPAPDDVQQGWTFEGGSFGLQAAGPAPAKVTVLTFNQLISRMTPQEQGALATAAMSNPQILLWMTMGAAANSVDLLSSDTDAGMMVLETAGVLTSARCAVILTP
jgi:hypothetical protein